MVFFGNDARGRPVSEAFQPDLIDFSFDCTEARSAKAPMEESIPLPVGWSFDRDRKQLLIEPSALSFSEFRAAFGYIASIGDAASTDTTSPFLLQVVTKLFFRYGFSPDEASDSFVYARVNAFSSKAVLGSNYAPVWLGMPVRGLLTPTDSDYATAQLNCWAPCSFQEWEVAIPRSFFDDGIAIDRDANFHLPLLGRRFLDVSGSSYSKLIIQPGRLKTVAQQAFILPEPKEKKPPQAKKKVKPADWEEQKAKAMTDRTFLRQAKEVSEAEAPQNEAPLSESSLALSSLLLFSLFLSLSFS